jgi:YVTN family beta-propeller protein
MRRIAHAGALLSTLVLLLPACSSDSATGANPGATGSPIDAAVTSTQSCPPQPGHPGGTILDKITAPSPWGVAVRDDGLAYFTELNNGGVGITSTKTRTVDGFITTGTFPTGIAFSPDGGTAYVTNQGDANVGVIDVASATQVATISTNGLSALAVRVSPDGTQLFVSTGSTTVFIIDIQSRQIVKSVEVGFAPNAFAVAPDGRILYVSAFLGGTVTEIDMFTGNVLRTFSVGGTPQDLALNRKGTHLYVANEQGYLNDIDLTNGQIGNSIALAGGAFGIGVTPDDNQAFISIPNAGLVQIFSLQQKKIQGSLNLGGNPRRIAFSQAGKIGAVTNASGFLTFVR